MQETKLVLGPSFSSKIIDHLQQTYCQSIGRDLAYIRNETIYHWLCNRMESQKKTSQKYSKSFKMTIPRKLSESVFLKNFWPPFPGQNAFRSKAENR
ncbi:MAG: hypothetical protein IPH20_25130 [Bacteroidales bacterium]|nr:hypothetical protein [Bacteroidales bacterium]